MSYFSVDVEADTRSPLTGSMVCFGAVLVADTTQTFYGETRPIRDSWIEKRLAVSGFTREQHEAFDDPEEVMRRFARWVKNTSKGRAIFISDNPAFDWQWINGYFDKYNIKNPFGHSAKRLGDLYAGSRQDIAQNSEWRKDVITPHDHTPVNDAKGVAEVLQMMKKQKYLKISL